MKRIIALLTVVIMVLSLAGCGDDKGATSKEDKIVNQDIGGAEFKLEEKGWEDKTTSKNYSFTSDDLNYDLSVSVTELSSNFTKNKYLDIILETYRKKKNTSYKEYKEKNVKINDNKAVKYSYSFADYSFYHGWIVFHDGKAYRFEFRSSDKKLDVDAQQKIVETISFEKEK